MADQTPPDVPQEPVPPPAEPVEEIPVDPMQETLRAIEQRFLSIEQNLTQVRIGVITAVSPLSVTLGGSSVAYTSVKATGGASFTTGDTVQCLVFGNDLIIQGKVGGIDVRDWEPGDIKWSRRSAVSAGWLLCNGASFSSVTYPELASALGGTTLPNLAGRFPVMVGSGISLGGTGGLATVALVTGEMPSHNHGATGLSTNSTGSHNHGSNTGSAGAHNHGGSSAPLLVDLGSGGGIYGSGSNRMAQGSTDNAPNHSHSISSDGSHSHTISGSTANAGSGTAHENRPPYFGLNAFIKT